MNKNEFLKLFTNDEGDLIPKRCTDRYVDNLRIREILNDLSPIEFGSVSDRIKHIKYGGGYCKVCGIRTNLDSRGRGFTPYCKLHAASGKVGKVAHNRKNIDLLEVQRLYVDENKGLLEISKIIGGISNVSLANRIRESGIFELRSHSENQKLTHYDGPYVGPRVEYDEPTLVMEYQNKIPVRVLAKKYRCSTGTIERFLKKAGVYLNHRTSTPEWIIRKILERNSIGFSCNDRQIIKPYELDFVIPQHSLAIEVNGLYHHSWNAGKKPKGYHKMKYDMSKSAGYRLFQFWDCDIEKKSAVIESMILNACGMTAHKINARDCVVVDVDTQSAQKFCDQNHIQGRTSPVAKGIGLIYNNELVALMCVTKFRGDIILSRYCTILGTNVRGGFSKILSTINGRIRTYSANSVSDGELYRMNGFTCIAEYSDDMWYTDYTSLLNRQLFQKQYLQKKLGNLYDPQKTEIENMINAGYDVLYGAGTKTWVLNK